MKLLKKTGNKLSPTIFFIVIASLNKTFAQDPTFNQFQNTPIYSNPSFAGTNENARISRIFRRQASGSFDPRLSFVFSYDQFVQPLKGGIGITLINDNYTSSIMRVNNSLKKTFREDLASTTFVGLAYSPKLVIGKRIMLSPSIQLGYGDKNGFVTYESFTAGSPSTFGSFIGQKNFFSVSSGLLVNNTNLFMGFSVHHINNPNISLIPEEEQELGRKYVFLTGGSLSLYKETLTFSPYLLFQRQYQIDFLSINGILTYKNLSMGIGYQNDPSIIFLIGYELFKRLNLRYSYEYREDIANSSYGSDGAHEVSIQYLFKGKKNRPEFKK